MWKRKYYIVTIAENGMALDLYYLGRMTKRKLSETIVNVNETFPFLFLVLSGWRVRHMASNKIALKINELKAPAPTSIAGPSKSNHVLN